MAVRTPIQRSLDLRVLIASAAAYTIAIATTWLQPVLVAELLAVRGTTEASAGLVLAVEMVAVSLSSAAYAKFGKGASFLTIAFIGTLLAAVGNVLSIVAPTSEPAGGACPMWDWRRRPVYGVYCGARATRRSRPRLR